MRARPPSLPRARRHIAQRKAEMSPNLQRIPHWIKGPIEALTVATSLLHVVTLLGIVLIPWGFTTSRTLQGNIAEGAIMGGVLSLFFTTNAWMGVAKTKRIRRRNWYVGGALVFYVVFVIGPV